MRFSIRTTKGLFWFWSVSLATSLNFAVASVIRRFDGTTLFNRSFIRAVVKIGRKLTEMDITVHCEISAFEWLMKWVKKNSAKTNVSRMSPKLGKHCEMARSDDNTLKHTHTVG